MSRRCQPSSMTPLYEFLIQKTVASKLCVQFKQVNSSWNIKQEINFTPEWFLKNRPAVVTVGNKYGQVVIISFVNCLMITKNIPVPILAEGFKNSIPTKHGFAPSNFDCFKGIEDSMVIADLELWVDMEFELKNSLSEMFDEISFVLKKTISPIQRYVLSHSLEFGDIFINVAWNCRCPLDFNCVRPWKKSSNYMYHLTLEGVSSPSRGFTAQFQFFEQGLGDIHAHT